MKRWQDIVWETARAARTISKKTMKLPFWQKWLSNVCREPWSGQATQGQNAVLTTLKHTCVWRSTAWWQNTEARNLKVDPNKNTRWKHKRAGTLELVCDKIASEWSGKEDWSLKRKRCQKAEDKRDCVTFTMMSVKHPEAHRPKIGLCATKKSRRYCVRQMCRCHFALKVPRNKCVETEKFQVSGSLDTVRWDKIQDETGIRLGQWRGFGICRRGRGGTGGRWRK